MAVTKLLYIYLPSLKQENINSAMAGAVVGGAFLSASLQVLFDRLASRSMIGSIWGGNQHDEALSIYKLKAAILSSEACLTAAGKKKKNIIEDPTLIQWLTELDEAVVDAQNILISNLPSEESQSKFFSSLRSSSISKSLETTLERLEYILRQKDAFNQLEEKPSSRKQQPTTCLIQETSIYGRDDDREAIMSMLVVGDDDLAARDKVSVVSIVGVPGVGKTTLVQILFNHARVEEYFDLKIWICTSNGLDISSATKTILEAITRRIPSSCCQIEDDLNQLQLRLREQVRGKRLLLVLDDVWNDNYKGALAKSINWTLRSRKCNYYNNMQ